jgi:hypothetical protein
MTFILACIGAVAVIVVLSAVIMYGIMRVERRGKR